MLLYFSDRALPRDWATLNGGAGSAPANVEAWRIAHAAADAPADRQGGGPAERTAGGPAHAHADAHAAAQTLIDDHGEAWQRYGARDGTVFVIRPDGYILGRWACFDAARIIAALAPFRRATQPADLCQSNDAEGLHHSDRSAGPSDRVNAEPT